MSAPSGDGNNARQQILLLRRNVVVRQQRFNLRPHLLHLAFIQFERVPMVFALKGKIAPALCQILGFMDCGFKRVAMRVRDQHGTGKC